MKVIVKICGIRRPEDASRAVELGASYVGCVYAPDSPRCTTVEEIQAVRRAVGDRAELVLVLRGISVEVAQRISAHTGVRRVQAHGVDSKWIDGAEDSGLVLHRVHALDRGVLELPSLLPRALPETPALLDVGRGGSGRSFNWGLLEDGAPTNTLIAGGIRPDNVRRLLAYQPFGIDVSSGIEKAPGEKDHAAMERLFAAVEEVQ